MREFLKDLLQLPGMMFYMLTRSFIAPMLWGMIITVMIIFLYIAMTG